MMLMMPKTLINPGGFTGAAGAAADDCNPNSGKFKSGCQPAPPSVCAMVCALSRPSEIHWRICSPLIGPYSFPSPPMIL